MGQLALSKSLTVDVTLKVSIYNKVVTSLCFFCCILVNEDEIVKALREIADEIDKQKFQGVNMLFQ